MNMQVELKRNPTEIVIAVVSAKDTLHYKETSKLCE
jgi:hypothetical protein